MDNFISYTPTKVVFGRDTQLKAGELVSSFGGTRVFIVYGRGSALKSGLIDTIKASVEEAGLTAELYGGAKANPTLAHAEEGVRKALDFGADFILAVGGGSTIDTAKAIAHGVGMKGKSLWDIWTGKVPLTASAPVAAVLTIPAAGSEMSDSAVLTNEQTFQKRGLSTEFNRCRFAIMNPVLAMTLPKLQLANGITDIMMHTLDRYFIPKPYCGLTDELAEGLLRNVITNGRMVVADPQNYDAMAEIMWSSSVSHNGLTGLGRAGKDFSVHAMGQALGGKYDFTHGATLSAVWPAWARYLYLKEDGLPRFSRYARKVWGVTLEDDKAAAEEGITRTEAYFKEIGMPVTITELGVSLSDEECIELAKDATRDGNRKLTLICPLGIEETAEIFRNAR
ncbi:MAG: iron-containing alcohol dehydrogenase [Blautia sp.]|nr:iron-containing alcohol dehydrogenase [Blautia sp.]